MQRGKQEQRDLGLDYIFSRVRCEERLLGALRGVVGDDVVGAIYPVAPFRVYQVIVKGKSPVFPVTSRLRIIPDDALLRIRTHEKNPRKWEFDKSLS